MTNVQRKVVITSPHGLHLRPIRAFVELAVKFPWDVVVCKGDLKVNGKSAIHLLGLEALPGTELTLELNGDCAGEAVEALAEALARVFPDDE
jgi:phosphocarrier protein HPr